MLQEEKLRREVVHELLAHAKEANQCARGAVGEDEAVALMRTLSERGCEPPLEEQAGHVRGGPGGVAERVSGRREGWGARTGCRPCSGGGQRRWQVRQVKSALWWYLCSARARGRRGRRDRARRRWRGLRESAGSGVGGEGRTSDPGADDDEGEACWGFGHGGGGALDSDTYSPAPSLPDPSEAALGSHVTPILSAVRLLPH